MKNKIKISITLDPKIVKFIDKMVKKEEYENRSQAIETILQSWSQQHQQTILHEEIATYYQSRNPKEEKEDEPWHQISEEIIRKW